MLTIKELIHTQDVGILIIGGDYLFKDYNTLFEDYFDNIFNLRLKYYTSLLDLREDFKTYEILTEYLDMSKQKNPFKTSLKTELETFLLTITYTENNYFILTIKDTSEEDKILRQNELTKKRLEKKNQALRNREHQVNSLLSTMPLAVMILTITKDGRITEVNSHFDYLTGYNSINIRQVKKLYDIVHVDYLQEVQDYVMATLRGFKTEKHLDCKIYTRNAKLEKLKLVDRIRRKIFLLRKHKTFMGWFARRLPINVNYDEGVGVIWVRLSLNVGSTSPTEKRNDLISVFLEDINEHKTTNEKLERENRNYVRYGISFLIAFITFVSTYYSTDRMMVINGILFEYNTALRETSMLYTKAHREFMMYQHLRTLYASDSTFDGQTLRRLTIHEIARHDRVKDSVDAVLDGAKPKGWLWEIQKNYVPADWLREYDKEKHRISKELYQKYSDRGVEGIISPQPYSVFDSIYRKSLEVE